MTNFFGSAIQNGEFRVTAPYSVPFIRRARQMDGKFDSVKRQWVFDTRNMDIVIAAMLELFGTYCDPGEQKIDLRIVFKDGTSELRGPITLCGRILAQARERDGGAKLGEGIVLESGKVTSGGSMKCWETIIQGGTVFIGRDFTIGQWQKIKDGKLFPRATITAINADSATVERHKLNEERMRLLQRLAEIDALLNTEAEGGEYSVAA